MPNKIYFLSDFHLGAPDYAASLQREKIVVEFLDSIKHDATEIFIVGDLFECQRQRAFVGVAGEPAANGQWQPVRCDLVRAVRFELKTQRRLQMDHALMRTKERRLLHEQLAREMVATHIAPTTRG